MSRRRLIVTADDFGMSPAVNAGVIETHRQGIVTATSLMVTGTAAAEAAALAREQSDLAVGLHLVLAGGQSALPPGSGNRLTDSSGRLGGDPVRQGLRFFFRRNLRSALRDEIRAQLDRFAATGLPLSHVDGHMHLHMHPLVLDILLELAPDYGVRAIRVTDDPLWLALCFDRRFVVRKTAEGAAFAVLASRARRRLQRHGIAYAGRVYGLHQSGRISVEYLLSLIPELRKGVTEVFAHPARLDGPAGSGHPTHYDPAGEHAALCDPRVRECLARNRVELTTYRELGNGGTGKQGR